VSYYDATFACGEIYAFINGEANDNYDLIYQHDPLGHVTDMGDGNTPTVWGANIFTAIASGTINAISIYANAANAGNVISIYTCVTADQPTSGTLMLTQTNVLTYAGYRTIALNSPVPVTAGQRFSVVVKMTTLGYNYPMPIESAIGGYSSSATASGRSYYSFSGTSGWWNLTNYISSADFCCKAFSLTDATNRAPTAPAGVFASDGAFTDKIQVTWDAASRATSYEVWRSSSNNMASGSKLATTATTTYDDLTVATTPGTVMYYWVKAVNTMGASGSRSPDSGYVQPAVGPTIKANGTVGEVTLNDPDAMSITIEMNTGIYAGAPADWWVVARAGSSWYYLNNSMQWTEFDGNLSNCHPVYQGGLFNLPATEVLNTTGLQTGSYTFWFAVDYPMDGILNLNGQILVDSVNVTVQ
jgi:hypothetical protein